MFCGVGSGDGGFQGLRVAAAAPGVVGGHHVDAGDLQVGEVVHGLDRVGGGAAVPSEELGREELDVPGHAGDADAVATAGADGPRHVGPVVVSRAVEDGVVAAVEVPPVHVVDEAVFVVVDTVGLGSGGAFAGVLAGVGGEVGMVVVVALVDDPDVDRRAAGVPERPRLGRLAPVGVGPCAEASPYMPQSEPFGVVRIVRRRIVGVDPVRLGVGDVGVRGEAPHGLGPVPAEAHQLEGAATGAFVGHSGDPPGVGPGPGLGPPGIGHAGPVPHQQLAGDGRRLGRRRLTSRRRGHADTDGRQRCGGQQDDDPTDETAQGVPPKGEGGHQGPPKSSQRAPVPRLCRWPLRAIDTPSRISAALNSCYQ